MKLKYRLGNADEPLGINSLKNKDDRASLGAYESIYELTFTKKNKRTVMVDFSRRKPVKDLNNDFS